MSVNVFSLKFADAFMISLYEKVRAKRKWLFFCVPKRVLLQ